MYIPDKQQAHSKSYEGPDLVQYKTQALFAQTNCNFVSATEQLPVYIYIYQVTICCWDSNLSTPVTNLGMLLLGVHWPAE